MSFKSADEEFQPIAKELFDKHRQNLNLLVDPVKVMFLRSDKKKKNAHAYCRLIRGEYTLLTNKKFFIVVVSKNFDELDSEEKKKYVILHELKHLFFDLDNEEKDKYALIKHNIEDFQQLLVNPKWNLGLVSK